MKFNKSMVLGIGGSIALVAAVTMVGIYNGNAGIVSNPASCERAYRALLESEKRLPDDRLAECRGIGEEEYNDIVETATADYHSDELREGMDVPGDAPEEDSDQPLELELADEAEWRDGVKASLTEFSYGTSGRSDSPSDTPYVKFKVRVDNDGQDILDLSAMAPECGPGSEGVFMDGVDGWLDSHLKPGRSVEWVASCSVLGDSLQVELTPSSTGGEYLYRTAIWQGQVKKTW